MTLAVVILALVIFLSGAVAGVLAMLVVGIRRGDHARHLADEPGTHLDAVTPQHPGRRLPRWLPLRRQPA